MVLLEEMWNDEEGRLFGMTEKGENVNLASVPYTHSKTFKSNSIDCPIQAILEERDKKKRRIM